MVESGKKKTMKIKRKSKGLRRKYEEELKDLKRKTNKWMSNESE